MRNYFAICLIIKLVLIISVLATKIKLNSFIYLFLMNDEQHVKLYRLSFSRLTDRVSNSSYGFLAIIIGNNVPVPVSEY